MMDVDGITKMIKPTKREKTKQHQTGEREREREKDRSLYSPKARERQHTHQGPPDELARRQLAPATAVD